MKDALRVSKKGGGADGRDEEGNRGEDQEGEITMQMEARRLSHSPEKVKHVFFILNIFILFQNLFSGDESAGLHHPAQPLWPVEPVPLGVEQVHL